MDKQTSNTPYSPEFRERAVRLFLEHRPEYPSEVAALRALAGKLGCTISHPAWGVLDVGEQCCDRLTSEIDASGHLRLWKSAGERKARFLASSLWTRIGGSLCRCYRDFYCEVHPDGDGYRLKLSCVGRGEIPGRTVFASEDEAKARLFDLVETGELANVFAKRFPRTE
jgi:hypothetical protein